MELSATELCYKLFVLQQDGINIPDYDKIVSRLKEFALELRDERRDMDYWCNRLGEFKICREAIEKVKNGI